jgi:hypothetical protein
MFIGRSGPQRYNSVRRSGIEVARYHSEPVRSSERSPETLAHRSIDVSPLRGERALLSQPTLKPVPDSPLHHKSQQKNKKLIA